MKVVILAGGFGTRLSEYTDSMPKPMVPVGGIPIIEHIMRIYANHGHKEFYVALGYKGEVIKLLPREKELGDPICIVLTQAILFLHRAGAEDELAERWPVVIWLRFHPQQAAKDATNRDFGSEFNCDNISPS